MCVIQDLFGQIMMQGEVFILVCLMQRSDPAAAAVAVLFFLPVAPVHLAFAACTCMHACMHVHACLTRVEGRIL